MFKHSKAALLMTKVYLFITLISLLITISGLISVSDSLPVIDQNEKQSIQLEQARHIVNIAINQNPDNRFLNHFYKADWLLTSNYNDLISFQKPAYDGDSFSRRIADFNQTANLTYEIYNNCITALFVLSIGSLVFINFGMVMTLTPLIIDIGSSATSNHARFALALFGEEIMTYIILIVGVIILLTGIVLFIKNIGND